MHCRSPRRYHGCPGTCMVVWCASKSSQLSIIGIQATKNSQPCVARNLPCPPLHAKGSALCCACSNRPPHAYMREHTHTRPSRNQDQADDACSPPFMTVLRPHTFQDPSRHMRFVPDPAVATVQSQEAKVMPFARPSPSTLQHARAHARAHSHTRALVAVAQCCLRACTWL